MWHFMEVKCVYTGRKAKVGNLREWSLTSLAQNRLTPRQQFCLISNLLRRLRPVETFPKLSMTSDFGCVALRCFASSVNG